jgi:hypothetical protein
MMFLTPLAHSLTDSPVVSFASNPSRISAGILAPKTLLRAYFAVVTANS